jgi:hypothetical protein
MIRVPRQRWPDIECNETRRLTLLHTPIARPNRAKPYRFRTPRQPLRHRTWLSTMARYRTGTWSQSDRSGGWGRSPGLSGGVIVFVETRGRSKGGVLSELRYQGVLRLQRVEPVSTFSSCKPADQYRTGSLSTCVRQRASECVAWRRARGATRRLAVVACVRSHRGREASNHSDVH